MVWTKAKPREPGFYWVVEAGETPHIVEIDVIPDSHNMMSVLLPGDDQRAPIEIFDGALWHGPLEPPG